jgi:hypothetical protein
MELMTRWIPALMLLASWFFPAGTLHAQMPFYTDDTSVTDTGKVHAEIFDEVDGLQSSQFPDLRQNTLNAKVNFSPVHGLELDIDVPYLDINRAADVAPSHGVGDTNLGVKWNFRETPASSTLPSFAVSFYVEFPTGQEQQELGSGLTDYALNFIVQKPLSDTTRFNVNLGLLFAGNTSTGAVGIQTRRGQVYTGGLSLLHDLNSRWTVGGELYGGVSDSVGLDKTQLQAMLGAQYSLSSAISIAVGILGGKFGATPRIGGQIGVSIDFPGPTRESNSSNLLR